MPRREKETERRNSRVSIRRIGVTRERESRVGRNDSTGSRGLRAWRGPRLPFGMLQGTVLATCWWKRRVSKYGHAYVRAPSCFHKYEKADVREASGGSKSIPAELPGQIRPRICKNLIPTLAEN